MPAEDSIRNEQTILRAELQELKRCQLTYFVLSVAGGGAILALGDGFPVSGDAKVAVFLAPLAIVIPCWVTFFDKATTITRLVGYMRVAIEEQLQSSVPQYIGYETALAKFRQEETVHPSAISANFRDLKFKTNLKPLFQLRQRHRYWMINWYTFVTLSATSCILPILFLMAQHKPIELWLGIVDFVGLSVSVAAAIFTLRIVLNLTFGRYSYDHVADYWRSFLFKP